MSGLDRFVTGYWGKALPATESSPGWHPLAYHNLDVAAAGDALLKVRPEYLDALSRISGLPRDQARSWLLFALAVHDLGKFADCFQLKWQRIAVSNTPFKPALDPGHGSVGAELWLNSCRFDCAIEDEGFIHLFQHGEMSNDVAESFRVWMDAVFGHHGRPVAIPPGSLKSRISASALADARVYVDACARLFPLAVESISETIRSTNFRRASWLVAGIAMLSDWIGSNKDGNWFPYLPPQWSVDEYWPLAQARAGEAIKRSGVARPPVAPAFGLSDALNFHDATATQPKPSDLQKWFIEDFHPTGQSLVIIEDLTGAGKTEAALIGSHRLMHCGAAQGLYWALPTMATANGLYTRLAKSYDRLFSDPTHASLVLAHGKRAFNETFQKSIKPVLPAGSNEAPFGVTRDDESASAQCAAWIADDRRKTFLADVGIGTLDQALIGILPAKHQAMRLASLSRRVLVVDEVHSYDAYTGKLLERLLEFHAAFGGSAILLTATLTQKLRAELAASFCRGAKWASPKLKETSFPLITTLTEGGRHTETPRQSGRGTRRDLKVERVPDEATAVRLLVESYNRNEASIWIRNTVHDAVSAVKLLREQLPEMAVDLFHARFALGDRIDIEDRTINNFGKSDAGQRHRVLLATQVVEQSLDLDFDVMVSDLAPIDLLIQRAGRLHRHDRGKRPIPILHVVGPEPTDAVDKNWYSAMYPKAQYVYPDHGQLWLTMKHLLNAPGLRLKTASPRDPIEFVFAESPDIPAGLTDVSGRAAGEAMARRGHAALNALKLSEGYARSAGTWDSDLVAPTRLGAMQRVVRLAKWDGAILAPWYDDADQLRAWRLSELQVLAGRVAEIAYDTVPMRAAVDALIASWNMRFDPPLVIPMVADGDVWRAVQTSTAGTTLLMSYSNKVGMQFG
jgi:CRISPR-associated endonuclease/helicase Cas3